MTPFINLDRRFRNLTRKELEDPEFLAMLNDRRFDASTLGWSDLLELPRVVVLAEAGSGKTRELEELAKRLTLDGKHAFFVPLETLIHGRPFTHDLSKREEESFETWKTDDRSIAWFLLDAKDEMVLAGGKLDSALKQLSKALDGHLERARVIISSRPSDWQPEIDTPTVASRLKAPVQRPRSTPLPPDPTELFLSALSRNTNTKSAVDLLTTKSEDHDQERHTEIRTVIMLKMSDHQVELFVKQSGVADASALVAEIGRRNAWAFATRPLDLLMLISTWKPGVGQLGTRAQQHEANVVAKLKEKPDQPYQSSLTDDRARVGAERLALALALTRSRTIKSPEQTLEIQRAEGVADPSLILTDWTDAERRTLLRRALFDPATHGRVRYHHRSVQEYLAARRLLALHENGMSKRTLLSHLFAERYGEQVVIPSMRPITAWLALWDNSVRQELTRREPETLLSLGDPESLSTTARAELLRAFAGAYGQGGWRGLNIPIDAVRRFAHSDLAPTVRELWGRSGPSNPDLRELLIEVVWQGPIATCADLAETAALDTTWDYYHRVVAVRALLAMRRDETVQEMAKGLVDGTTEWPDKGISELAVDLFPKFISVDDLMLLIKRTVSSQNGVGGFGLVARQIVEGLEPLSELAVELRKRIAEVIWEGRRRDQQFHQIRGGYDYLTPALATLCARQLGTAFCEIDLPFLRACVIASRFDHDAGAREPVQQIRELLQRKVEWRSLAFWAELDLMDELVPTPDEWTRFYHAERDGIVGRLVESDRSWLEAALADDENPTRRPVALHVLLNLWQQRGLVAAEATSIRRLLKGDDALELIFAQRTKHRTRDPKLEQWERDNARRQREHERADALRIENWLKWRDDLLADPARFLSLEDDLTTVSNIYLLLQNLDHASNRHNVWNGQALEQMFGLEVTQRVTTVFQTFWRKNPPALWSARATEGRNSTLLVWIYGLCGIASEAALPDWTKRLTREEARVAVVYATIETNGFADFLVDLTNVFPRVVDEVVGGELIAELEVGPGHDYLPVLNNLVGAHETVKRVLAPRLLVALRSWSQGCIVETVRYQPQHLRHVLQVLDETIMGSVRDEVADVCLRQYSQDPAGPLALVWLRGLFRFDLERAAEATAATWSRSGDAANQERANATFADLFGDRDDKIVFDVKDVAKRARALRLLVLTAFTFVRHEDDLVHEGIYSLTTRDYAERARSFLFSSLVDTPGPEARDAILEIAGRTDFSHFPDRFRLLARGRAAVDAEFVAFSVDDVNHLEKRYEVRSYDRDTLFDVTMERLSDLDHDISHDDFSDRGTLRTISTEAEMQRTLALRLKAHAKGAYLVTREEEVADSKRTDIRLLAVSGEQKAVIEIKLADNRWALSDFERALRYQLVGQYLRHDSCKAGVLLLTYDGKKRYWMHPGNRRRLDFSAMVEYLREKARGIEAELRGSIRLGVYGIDLRDPELVPAHKR